MIIRAQRLVPERRSLEPVAIESLPADWSELPTPVWIDIQAAAEDDLRLVLAPLQLHQVFIEECLSPTRGATFNFVEDAMVFSYPTRQSWDETHSTPLAVLVMENVVVTFHPEPVSVFDRLIEACGKNIYRLVGEDTAAVLYHVLDALIDHVVLLGLHARGQVETFIRELGTGVDSEAIARLNALRMKVTSLASTFEDQMFGITALQTAETPVISIARHATYFKDLAGHLEYSLRLVERVDKRLAEVGQSIFLGLQERVNRRLMVMGVLTMIFSPSVLIAGVYGMNFHHIPELPWKYGYPMALSLMATVSGGMLLFFWAKGWFK